MKLIRFIVNSYFFLSIAAVLLSIQTMYELGLKFEFNYFYPLIFFATLFEYNLHRFVNIRINKELLGLKKYEWLLNNLKMFYLTFLLSVIGLSYSLVIAEKIVWYVFAPIALVTIFYSVPILRKDDRYVRLKSMPFVKTFAISFVWAFVTVFLPLMHTTHPLTNSENILLFFERFFFVLAIAIPFDVRDIKQDVEAGVKTIGTALGEKLSLLISNLSLLLFAIVVIVLTKNYHSYSGTFALLLSGLISMTVINFSKFKKNIEYYNVALDGMLVVQSVLVLLFNAF